MRRILPAGAVILALMGSAPADGYAGTADDAAAAFHKQAVISGASKLTVKKQSCSAGEYEHNQSYDCIYDILASNAILPNFHFIASSDKKGGEVKTLAITWENWGNGSNAREVKDWERVGYAYAVETIIGMMNPGLTQAERRKLADTYVEAAENKEYKIQDIPSGIIYTRYNRNIPGAVVIVAKDKEK